MSVMRMKLKMMNNCPNKYLKILIIIMMGLIIASCENLNNSNIYGLWTGIYKGKTITLKMNEDNTCQLNYYEKEDIVKISGSYELDYSKRPIPMDITNISEINNSLYTIIEFVGINTIVLAEFSPEWKLRPITFENGKSVELKRK